MKNKDKFDLKKITFFDTNNEDGTFITVLYNNEIVAKFNKEDTYIDSVFKWLEKEYSEYSPEEVKKSRKQKKEIKLPEIDFDVEKINKLVDESSESAKRKARRERRKARKEKTA